MNIIACTFRLVLLPVVLACVVVTLLVALIGYCAMNVAHYVNFIN